MSDPFKFLLKIHLTYFLHDVPARIKKEKNALNRGLSLLLQHKYSMEILENKF